MQDCVSACAQGRTLRDITRRLVAWYGGEEQPGDDGHEGHVAPSAFNWSGLGAAVSAHFKGAPPIYCMLGPLESQAKMRRVGVRQPRQALAAEVRPQDIQVSCASPIVPACLPACLLHPFILAIPWAMLHSLRAGPPSLGDLKVQPMPARMLLSRPGARIP